MPYKVRKIRTQEEVDELNAMVRTATLMDEEIKNLNYLLADFSEISYPKDKDSIFVAISGGKIVGGAQYDSDPASIVQIYVHPDHRSIGIGRRLLKSIEKVAMNQGKKSISAEATSDSFDFYESCGYEIIEGEDEIMKKRLKSTRKK